MGKVMRITARVTLGFTAATTLGGCALVGGDMPSEPVIYVYRYQQVWLTPDERELAQCWNGGALTCAGGLGRLSTLLCECPL